MNKGKINMEMGMMDIALIMSEGNPVALTIVMEMMSDPRSILDILLLDTLDIRGSKLYLLYADCCGRDKDKFTRTLMMLRCGIYTEKEIHDNLSLIRAIPFADDTVVLEGIPTYGESFGPGIENWDAYCNAQKEAFVPKLAEKVMQEEKINKER